MDKTTIFSTTAKGLREATGKTKDLPRKLRNLLKEVDGRSPFGTLHRKLSGDWSENALQQGLEYLAGEGFIRELIIEAHSIPAPAGRLLVRPPPPPYITPPQLDDSLDDLDFTAVPAASVIKAEEKARREAEEQVRREAEEKSRREVEEQARRAAEEQARREAEEKVRREAEEQARREVEEQVRREAEEKTRREAEEKARREAEEQARRVAEEQVRREAEEQVRREAEEKARREAEEQARREAEEQARREVEEQARRAAEEQARREAEEKARREAEEQARREAEEREFLEDEALARAEVEEEARIKRESYQTVIATMPVEPRPPLKWGKSAALGLAGLILAAIIALNMMSFADRIPVFEEAASAQFQQPVKIKSLRVAFLPHAQWQLEGVVIGGAGQILVPRINIETSYAALFDKNNKSFKSVQIDTPVVSMEGLGWLLFGRPQSAGLPGLQLRHVKASNIKLNIPDIVLPIFDATLEMSEDGNWQTIDTQAAGGKLAAKMTAGAALRLEVKMSQSALPFGSLPAFDDLTAAGTFDPHALQIDEFTATLYGGTLSGSARMKWGAEATLDGEMTARMIDMGRLLSGFMESGRLEGQASFSLPASKSEQTISAARLKGEFTIDKGALATVDFGRLLKGESGGRTQFKKLTGNIATFGDKTQLRQLAGDAGKLTATGNADIDEQRNIKGQVSISLSLGSTTQRTLISVSGPFKAPYKELKWQ